MAKTFKDVLTTLATDEVLHTSLLYHLSKMDRQMLDAFREMWPTIAIQRRRDIMQELMELSEVNFEVDFGPVFMLALGDEDAEVRETAIQGLWENESPTLITPFLHILRTDEAVNVRAAAATALSKYIYLREIEELDPTYVAPIEQALLEIIRTPTEDIEVRRRAVEAIAFSGEEGIPEIIENAYYDDNVKMRVSAVFAMGRSADSRWLPRVLAELDSPINEIRYEAARACGELEARKAVPRLVELARQDPDIEIQEMAIWSLGKIGGDEARDALISLADSENEAVAFAAEDALDELNLFSGVLDMFSYDPDNPDDDEFFDYLLDDDDGLNGRNF